MPITKTSYSFPKNVSMVPKKTLPVCFNITQKL
jgi:hypothetical protein